MMYKHNERNVFMYKPAESEAEDLRMWAYLKKAKKPDSLDHNHTIIYSKEDYI